MTKDEALKLALEYVELVPDDRYNAEHIDREALVTAIKELLMSVPDGAQPEHEPVAWRAWVSKFPQGTGSDWVYVTKPIMKDRIHNQPLYTTPPQRTWVGLTDEEVNKLVDDEDWYNDPHGFAQAIESKLRSKNNV